MCWRDGLSERDRHEEFENDMRRIRQGNTLVQAEARKGDNGHVAVYNYPNAKEADKGKIFFRRDTFSTLSGPVDTTELLLKPGTLLVVSAVPEEIRKKFGLRARDAEEGKVNLTKHSKIGGPRARVVELESGVGFSFGQTGKKVYFPLQNPENFVAFRVLSLPKSKVKSLSK